MENEILIEKIKSLTLKEISLSSLCSTLEADEFEILGIISSIRKDGINIVTKKHDDDIYLLNLGEKENRKKNETSFNTDNNNEFKFVAISDTRIGSKSQQLSILNDIYEKANELGYNTVIHCGNITEGLYSANHDYADSTFLDDSQIQVDYITKNYPKFDNIKTYFITGTKDLKHLKKNSISIGRRINNARDDLIYLGQNSCNIKIDNTNMKILNSKLAKTYTVSYRIQQQIDSFRSEDKPDILLLGGLLQMEKLTHRGVKGLSIPSVCATTDEMNEKRHANTIGAWYITVKTDEKGKLESIKALDSVYYTTDKDDYKNKKYATNIITSSTQKDELINKTDIEFVERIYKYMKNGMPVEIFMDKFHCNRSELNGILELCKIYDKDISISIKEGIEVFNKPLSKSIT